MKKIKLTGLLALALMCSCKIDKKYDLPYYDYYLRLSILDAAGNDIVKRIGLLDGQSLDGFFWGATVKPDLYTMEVVFPEPCMDIYHPQPMEGVIYDECVPKLAVDILGDNYYLVLRTISDHHDECPNPAKTLTFKLKCPELFGDDSTHEIVTYWKEGNTQCRLCYRFELDGKEYTQISYEQYDQISCATVILDDK